MIHASDRKFIISATRHTGNTDAWILVRCEFYWLLRNRYAASPGQLLRHNFPLPDPDRPGHARFPAMTKRKKRPSHQDSDDLQTVRCVRCSVWYQVNPDGTASNPEETCVHHWGKLQHPSASTSAAEEGPSSGQRSRSGRNRNRVYSCCGNPRNSPGCTKVQGHVPDVCEACDRTPYVRTQQKPPGPDGDYGVYAVDCEMVYTTAGCELARVSVVDSDLRTVYDTLVKPEHQVLDYVTRYSGVTEDMLRDVTTRLPDVQVRLLELFNDQTILIGHSLENDLRALKLIHLTVVDTSLVFTHPKGLPFKRSLKDLVKSKLKLDIQTRHGTSGHDSAEDARACMQVMLLQAGYPWRQQDQGSPADED